MKDKGDNKHKKPYEKPAVIFSKKIEVISIVCDSSRNNQPGCRKVIPSCTRTSS